MQNQKQQLMQVGEIFSVSLKWTLNNLLPILGALILWFLTCWIPYLNIGTTIALMCMPLELSKGKAISPTYIFNKKYFRYMGEFFLLVGLRSSAILVGLSLFIIPAIVLSYTWRLSFYILIDKEVSPLQALTDSNKATYGFKSKMFIVDLILMVGFMIVSGIFGWIPFLGGILVFAAILILSAFVINIDAYYYKALTATEEVQPEPIVPEEPETTEEEA